MDLIQWMLAFKYPAIFFLSILEGPVTMAAVGFLLKLNYFSFLPAYLALLFGDLTGDIGWYAIGYYGAHRFIKRFGKFLSITEESSARISRIFRNHEGKILFLSKITMGFGFAVATLFTAGMSKVPLKKFIFLNFLGGLFWTGLMMLLGYTFGHVYLKISEGLRIVSIVVFIVILLLALKGFGSYVKTRYSKMSDDSV